jgi:hypothetical protein
MRKALWVGACSVALGLGASVASADVITIALTGHVQSVNDSSLGVTVGQAVTATYSYDTSTPAGTAPPPNGTGLTYPLAVPPANASVQVVGGPSYQAQPSWPQQIYVTTLGFSTFGYTATNPASSSSFEIAINFRDFGGQWLSPPSLPTTAPPNPTSPPAPPEVVGTIFVQPPNSSGFYVQVDSVALAPSITVSPSNSSFIAQQNFDAVLLLSAQLSVTSMQASVNGTSIGFSYPGTCQLAPANNAQRAALICPNAAAVLAGLGGGPVTINWLITFADGSTAQQSVIWNLVL